MPTRVCRSGRADFEYGELCGYADAQGETVEARSAMDVESTGATREEPLIRPTRPRQNRPIEAEGDEADLSAMSVARKYEIDFIIGQRVECQRIVEEQ